MPLLRLLWLSVRPGPAQGSEGVSFSSYQGQASSDVLRVMEEKLLTELLGCSFSVLFCFKTGSHIVQADLELPSSYLKSP